MLFIIIYANGSLPYVVGCCLLHCIFFIFLIIKCVPTLLFVIIYVFIRYAIIVMEWLTLIAFALVFF